MWNKIYTALACVILLSSCHQTKSDIVADFVDATNSYNKEKAGKYLSDDFIYLGNDSLGKSEYLSKMDSVKSIEQQSLILKIQESDNTVKTEEKIISIIDSMLEVTPKVVLEKTYRFAEDKFVSVTVDSTLYYDDYIKSYNDKIAPFTFFVKEQYDVQDESEYITNIKKYLAEYVSLPASDKKKFRTYGNLQGTYISKDCAFYRKLIFRGKSTVTIVDAFFGMSFATSYEVDEDVVRIRTDKSDLLFEIKDGQTLIGEGFAKGTFIKK